MTTAHELEIISHLSGQLCSSPQVQSSALATTARETSVKLECESRGDDHDHDRAFPPHCGSQQAASSLQEQPNIMQPTWLARSSHPHISGDGVQLDATTATTAAPPLLLSRLTGSFDPVAAVNESERRYRENLLLAEGQDNDAFLAHGLSSQDS